MKEIPGITVGEDDSIGKQMIRAALRRYSIYTCNVCRIRYEPPCAATDNGECPECRTQTGTKLEPVFR